MLQIIVGIVACITISEIFKFDEYKELKTIVIKVVNRKK